MRTRLALLWTSMALLCCGGRTAAQQAPSAEPGPTGLSGWHFTAEDEASLRDVAAAADGRLALAGFYRGQPDFDQLGAEVPDATTEDGFVIVLDEQALAKWSEPLPGLGAQGFTGVAFAPSGDLLAQGSGNNRDDDATAATPNGTAWMMRFDQEGGVKQRKGFSGDRTMPARIASDSQDSAILIGNFTGALDFYGPQEASPPYLIRLDASGALQSISHVPVAGDPTSIQKLALAVDDDSVTLIATRISTHNAGLIANEQADGFVNWGQDLGANPDGSVALDDVALDAAGNVIVVGSYEGRWQLGELGLPTARDTQNAWLAKLSREGDVIWAKAFPPVDSGQTATASQVATSNGDILFVGTGGSLDLGNAQLLPRVAGNEIAFAVLVDSSGNVRWTRHADANGVTFRGLASAPNGKLWAGGDFTGFIDLSERHEVAQGNLDAFLVRLEP